MRLNDGMIALALSATVLASASAMTGCASGERVYDPYRQDYRQWNRGESRLYQEWEAGTHRNHMDFRRRSATDQQAYWAWRHR